MFIFYIQFEAERYINRQIVTYNILEGRSRRIYRPFFIWLLVNRNENNQYSKIPYLERGIKIITANNIYDEYMYYCYYSREEKDCIRKEFPKHYNCLQILK